MPTVICGPYGTDNSVPFQNKNYAVISTSPRHMN
jgi:hypothetical protein